MASSHDDISPCNSSSADGNYSYYKPAARLNTRVRRNLETDFDEMQKIMYCELYGNPDLYQQVLSFAKFGSCGSTTTRTSPLLQPQVKTNNACSVYVCAGWQQ